MKIAILTNETKHHAYFVREIKKTYEDLLVIIEKNVYRPKFETVHAFELEREKYEQKVWFNGEEILIKKFSDIISVQTVNEEKSINVLKNYKPEILVLFGTGILKKELISLFPDKILNLHGGDPEYYRGLDSHYWAIYHNDFTKLISTIHKVNESIDDGDIILQESLSLFPEMNLWELRRLNTEVCVKLALTTFEMYKMFGLFISRKQISKGRYYSFMPSELKETVLNNFDLHIKSL